jgi:hypothetical protein
MPRHLIVKTEINWTQVVNATNPTHRAWFNSIRAQLKELAEDVDQDDLTVFVNAIPELRSSQ